MSDDKLEKIAALLRKAEKTDNEHEADAYLQAAQRLSTLYQVDLQLAARHVPAGQQREVPTQRTVHIGQARKVGLKTYCTLFLRIAHANNLKCDIARDGTTIYAYGFASDIDMTEALYTSLIVQMIKASDAYIRAGSYKTETTFRMKRVKTTDWYGRPMTEMQQVYAPVSGRTARVAFQEAFAYRIGERLREAQESAVQEAVQDMGASTALVLVERKAEVEALHKKQSTAKGHFKGSSHQGSAHATQSGYKAGSRARIGTQSEIGGSRKALVS